MELNKTCAVAVTVKVRFDTAQAYSDLKGRLVQTCNGDIDAYVDGKDAFVKEIERKALEWTGVVA